MENNIQIQKIWDVINTAHNVKVETVEKLTINVWNADNVIGYINNKIYSTI